MRAYDYGSEFAAAQLGLIKTATPLALPPAGGTTTTPGPFWPGVGQDIKKQLIGDPAKYWEEIRNGTWHQKGSYARSKMFNMPDVPAGASVLQKGMAYMGPVMSAAPLALGLYGAYRAPETHRGEAYGRTLGSFVGHMAGAPLGSLGQMAFGTIGEHLGGSVGKLFNARPERSSYARARDERYSDGRPPMDR